MLDQAGREAVVIRRTVTLARAAALAAPWAAAPEMNDFQTGARPASSRRRISYTALIGRKNPLSSIRIAG